VFVDMVMLHSGATDSSRAGEHAQTGNNQLARAPLPAGMFGDFEAAQTFLETVTAAHAHHVRTLESHREFFNGIGRSARSAANEFTAMEVHNTTVMREAECT
jgi:hypothetical protein